MVEVGHAVHFTTKAECLASGQALMALTAAAVLITPANAVVLLELLDVWTDGFDDTGTFAAEAHVLVLVMYIG